jgi:hypothetical protein
VVVHQPRGAFQPRPPILNIDVGGIIALTLLPDRYSRKGSCWNRLSMRTADCATFAMLLEIEAAAEAQASGFARTAAFSDVTRSEAGKGARRNQW